ncbi:hypothetical protein GA0115240_13791, partial [Streptomyces sp. DvalAA-14]
SGGPAGRPPRFGRRAKILAVAAAVVIVAGTVAVTAVANGNKDDDAAAVNPASAAPTSLSSAPGPAATSPAAGATSASPTTSPSPSHSATTAPATRSTPTPTATTPTSSPSGRPANSPTTTPTAVPTTPSTGPTTTTGSAAGPHVSSVAVTGITCTAGSHTATATVLVRYDGTAAGTLHLTWWRSGTGGPQGAVTMNPQTAKFPKGATSYTFTDKLTFTPDAKHPYVGLTVSTDPAAAAGNGSYGVGCR